MLTKKGGGNPLPSEESYTNMSSLSPSQNRSHISPPIDDRGYAYIGEIVALNVVEPLNTIRTSSSYT